eukprot:Tbor_TRINITY_DN5634_c2_g5::TRINITY_DN5634_c2_g5_i1::g.9308::m.9308/K00803/AGPS, agpS; alkyldihydroxyacetonephosphate synthase
MSVKPNILPSPEKKPQDEPHPKNNNINNNNNITIPKNTTITNTKDIYTRIKWNGWGNKNKEMILDPKNPNIVIHASGKQMPNLARFAHQEINGGIGPIRALDKTPSITIEEAILKLPVSIINDGFISQVVKRLSRGEEQIKADGESRIGHLFGKNYRDLWRVRTGFIQRAPDIIILPENHDDCVIIMKYASDFNVVIVPFGGGTNVTGGVEASLIEKRRMIVSVDMRRMNKMKSIDKVSRVAVFEAGVLGPDMDEALERHGFMFGHDPDSYIHSTLGGWIATRSSGALSNKYGDIENMTLSLKVVTPNGVIETPLTSRPCGPDLNALFIGSEGHFGIITEACVKIEPIPDVRRYEGWLFPSFISGYEAFYKCTRKGIHPTCMRLYDEDDTRMSFALKTEEPLLSTIIGKGVKQYLEKVKGWNLNNICLCIIGHEGSKQQVAFDRKTTAEVLVEFGGFPLGKGAGAGWQEKKYDLPFIRDFALSHKMYADVFETSVLYSEAIPCWRSVKKAVRDVWKEEGDLKGWIGCHCAHQYRFGCCLYFTFAGQQFDQDDMKIFLKIKNRVTDEILKFRGSVSHHHGVGYEHVPWIERYMGTPTMELLLSMKKTIDPQDICNPHKLLPVQRNNNNNNKEDYKELERRRRDNMIYYKAGIPPAKM